LTLQPEARALEPLANSLQLSSSSGHSFGEIQFVDDAGVRRFGRAPIERSLMVLVDGRPVGTLMTLGAGPEWLVVGYLRNQRLITDVTELQSVNVDWQSGTAVVGTRRRARGIEPATELASDQFASTRISRSTLLSIVDGMRRCGAVFRAAGSVHGCALFNGADLWVNVEDVSRRNTLDIISGWMAVHGISGQNKALFTTGRLSTEMVTKAAYSGIPVLVTRKGITATGYELAQKLGMIVFGRAIERRYVCYTGIDRFDTES
jgi:FdhD protein